MAPGRERHGGHLQVWKTDWIIYSECYCKKTHDTVHAHAAFSVWVVWEMYVFCYAELCLFTAWDITKVMTRSRALSGIWSHPPKKARTRHCSITLVGVSLFSHTLNSNLTMMRNHLVNHLCLYSFIATFLRLFFSSPFFPPVFVSQVYPLRFRGVGRGRSWRTSWMYLRWRTPTGWSTVTLRWCCRMKATRSTSNSTATSQFTATFIKSS